MNKEMELVKQTIIGDVEKVKQLIKEVDNRESRYEAFIEAIQKGNIEIVKILIEEGAEIFRNENEPFREASLYSQLEVMKILIEEGADVHARRDDALKTAFLNEDKKTIEFLSAYYSKSKIAEVALRIISSL